jgi:nucleoside-diphosphate-sugar epimerase
MEWFMMKALVTGGTGFLGQALSLQLQQAGFEVTILGRNPNLCEKMHRANFTVVQADLTDKRAVIAACQNQHYVFHCGAFSSPWGRYQDFYATNVVGTENIVAGCFKHNVERLIHVSTPSIYFNYTNRVNISESEPLPNRFVNSYATTKQLAENVIDAASNAGLAVITIRPRALFGPGDTTILPRLIKAHHNHPLPLFNEGKVFMDVTYIDNVVDALIACMQAPASALGQKFNITNDEPVYFITLLKKLFSTLEIPLKTRPTHFKVAYCVGFLLEKLYALHPYRQEPPFTRYTLGLLGYDQTLDVSAAKKILNYVPRISLDQGLERYCQSLDLGHYR